MKTRAARVMLRCLVVAAALLAPAAAGAQALERHPAPGLPPAAAPQVAPPAPSANDDATPLGPMLTAVTLIGAADALPPPQGPGGVDVRRLAAADRRPVERAIRPFLGKPLSRKLISEVEAAVVRVYRRAGRPFVSVSAPPQQISAGRLALRVIVFRLGSKAAAGASRRVNAAMLAGIRAPVGQPISAPALEQDLAWLNRSLFHQVTASFSPGAELGETDLSLHVATTKPWQVGVGYANDGTPSSGMDRWSLSAAAGDLLVPGSLVSYQMTTSSDFWDQAGHAFGAAGHPQYFSNSLAIDTPLAPRVNLSLTGDFIESRTTAQGGLFATGDVTGEASALVETALPNVALLPGELDVGWETRRQRSATFFGSFPLGASEMEVDQAVLGLRWAGGSPASPQNLSLFWRASPGGISGANSDASFAAFSHGRVRTSTYAYMDLAYAGVMPLPGGWRYAPSVSLQIANRPLLDTEQMALGGVGGARTYVYDDGAFDSGFLFRSEVRAPAIDMLASWRPSAPGALTLAPFFFADVAHGWDLRGGPDASAASLGAGFDLGVRGRLSGRLAAGWSLTDAPLTRAGAFKLLSEVRVSY